MKPVQEMCEDGMTRAALETVVAVFCDDVLDNGAGFGEHDIAVGYDRRRTDRMQRLVVGRRQHGCGVARIAFEFIRNFQLLAEPDDALGLRFAEMVDGEHEGPPPARHSRKIDCSFTMIEQPAARSNPRNPRPPRFRIRRQR